MWSDHLLAQGIYCFQHDECLYYNTLSQPGHLGIKKVITNFWWVLSVGDPAVVRIWKTRSKNFRFNGVRKLAHTQELILQAVVSYVKMW